MGKVNGGVTFRFLRLRDCESYLERQIRGGRVGFTSTLFLARPRSIRCKNIIEYAKFYSRLLDAVIRVYNDAGNMIDADKHKDDFKKPRPLHRIALEWLLIAEW